MPSTVTEHDAAFNRKAWDARAATRTGQEPVLYWHFRDAPGPGVELLGSLTGEAVAELRCGNGSHLAHIPQGSRCAVLSEQGVALFGAL
ncbi:hypothetical protein GPA10_10025 [Streptomyces sp. p1417]|uniref:Uncharacterized protein n=1 Tax=Streptomyces typhae TaxID=2681492 RepID=A0A6L6WWQ2_9ACTN|nr:hypothetical protein [Streptomyces typhae]MVO85086.1 hypothetical protein [Streptomyces typhae]